jgi:hypothetical protein
LERSFSLSLVSVSVSRVAMLAAPVPWPAGFVTPSTKPSSMMSQCAITVDLPGSSGLRIPLTLRSTTASPAMPAARSSLVPNVDAAP